MSLGAATWRSGGRGAVLGGAIIASVVAYIELDSAVRYVALSVFAASVLITLVTSRLSAWRFLRTELLLAGASAACIGAWQIWPGGPTTFKSALAILAGVFAASFIAVTFVRFTRLLRPRPGTST